MSDDFTGDEDFSETQGVWWAGIALASVVTFAAIGGLLVSGTYVLTQLTLVDIPYWVPIVTAAILTISLVTVSVVQGKIEYEPR